MKVVILVRMKPSIEPEEYQILDCGEFQKLESLGNLKIVRPATSAFWKKQQSQLWKDLDWEFERFEKGQGEWKKKSTTEFKDLSLQCGPLLLKVRPTPFGHIGLFAEQIPFWWKILKACQEFPKPMKVLNLFAYTGGSTLAAAMGGAEVVHVDASKASVDWARENAELNGLESASIRWIQDDVSTFVKREIRRESHYDAIILDPPSYGRGAKNQLWKIDEDLLSLIEKLKLLLASDFAFLHLSAHTPGLSALTLENLLRSVYGNNHSYKTEEMIISSSSGLILPSGTSCWMSLK